MFGASESMTVVCTRRFRSVWRCARARLASFALAALAMAAAGCADDPRDGALEEPAPLPGALRSWPLLRQGTLGDDVRAAQRLLRHRGQPALPEAEAPADEEAGSFGPAMAASVRAFQQARGLVVDGVIGPVTWEALIAEVSAGDASWAVRAAQELLMKRAGAMLGPDGANGEAGAETTQAIAALQVERCLAGANEAPTPSRVSLGVYGWSALVGDFGYCEGGPDGEQPPLALAELGRDAGVPCGEALEIAVAIAAAESGRRGTAINRNGVTAGCPDGSADVGLWQINDCYHPEVSRACALDAACSAAAMYDISRRGTDWTPWTTYRTGAYRDFVATAHPAVLQACR